MRVLSIAVVIAALASGAAAQQSTNRVAANTDWSVFVDKDPKECWAVSAPKETVNSKDGKVVEVRRGDVLLFVTYRSAKKAGGEVSFTGGYPFADGSTISLTIDTAEFDLFSNGEWAWPAGPDDDTKILDAMKKGSQAVLTGESGRGTQTKDTFSLLGFTAAVAEADKRCAS